MHQTLRENIWDETDFALFYQQHASPILDYLRTQTRTLEDAEDLLVNVFLAARQTPQIGQEIVRGQIAWPRQVARNKLIDSYRREGQSKTIPLHTGCATRFNSAKKLRRSRRKALNTPHTFPQVASIFI